VVVLYRTVLVLLFDACQIRHGSFVMFGNKTTVIRRL